MKKRLKLWGQEALSHVLFQRLKKITLIKGVTEIAELINCHVHIPKPPIDLPYAIFGRDTIFQEFQITFREYEQRFLLRRKPI